MATARIWLDKDGLAGPDLSFQWRRAIADWLKTSLPFIALIAITIESLLLYRFWILFSGNEPGALPLKALYSLTDLLVWPFRSFERPGDANNLSTIDISTLVAMDVYLVSALALVFAVTLTRSGLWLFQLFPHKGDRSRAASDGPVLEEKAI